MVMGGDSCSEGRGFESQHNILDGHFSHTFAVKIVMFEKTKINEKDAEDGPFFKKISLGYFLNFSLTNFDTNVALSDFLNYIGKEKHKF